MKTFTFIAKKSMQIQNIQNFLVIIIHFNDFLENNCQKLFSCLELEPLIFDINVDDLKTRRRPSAKPKQTNF